MRTASIFLIMALAGTGVACTGPNAFAQGSAARDATIHKCINEAHAQIPNEGRDTQRARTDFYVSCMRNAGLDP